LTGLAGGIGCLKKLIILLLVVLTAWKFLSEPGSVSLGPGVHAQESPKQIDISNPSGFDFGDYRIIPLADFQIKAKVLSREEYSIGREADLSPVDLALGWGRMSDEAVIQQIEISQSSRWYSWYTDKPPIPLREIETHSANMHLVPADEGVESQINRARTGDIIEMTGKLVEITAADGWRWKSSLTREDTGNHACEVVWVERFSVVEL
jgi:hypothetical protein